MNTADEPVEKEWLWGTLSVEAQQLGQGSVWLPGNRVNSLQYACCTAMVKTCAVAAADDNWIETLRRYAPITIVFCASCLQVMLNI